MLDRPAKKREGAPSTSANAGNSSNHTVSPKPYEMVFIYDLNDVLIFTKSHFEEHLATMFPPDFSYLSNRWKRARECMALVNLRSPLYGCTNYANVAITKDPITEAVAKVRFAELTCEIPTKDIYSTFSEDKKKVSRKITKILKAVQKRFGVESELVVVTSDDKITAAAERLSIKVWPAFCETDFENLFHKLNEDWCQIKQPCETPEQVQTYFSASEKNGERRQEYIVVSNVKLMCLTEGVMDSPDPHNVEMLWKAFEEDFKS